ncbi:SPOR domain-containing protein [Novosphingobium sp. KA1]|uniref:SPOR domain-containing protein n=1 Tax=Novosphingobium sp. (strain KA1) TaxID=164608 RepID=UPI001AF4A917|nr:SPOR domain-containing protein [Novosphingobium sp. KA1]QSR17928.1 sporulation protein [Novosphingobium sp. KA1]
MATPSLGAAADASGGANTVKAGVEAWSAGQYETAVQLWKPLADKGDADAQFNLAQAYKMGRGVPLDLARAESLYGKAAAHGHVQAADNYGLLMFQRGERDAAMPYIAAASARGDARAQYILGVAHFNGDLAEKDWVRAYALVSLAQQAGLPQATRALTQMDEHIPIEQRQQGVALAVKLAADAEAARARLDTSASLGAPATARAAPPPPPSPTASPTGPAAAGADYARPQATAAPQPVRPISNPAVTRPSVTRPAVPSAVTKPAATTAPKPFPAKPATPSPAQGQWRLQLGAFGVPGNAERLWSSLAKRPELAGKRRELVPGGSLTRLYAAGFATRSEAEKACAALKGPSQPCLVVPAH